MAYIQERVNDAGKLSYRVQIRLKGHPTETATFARKTDARLWAQQTETAIREGRHFKTREAKRHTLAELVKRYEREVLPRKRDVVNQRRQLEWWSDRIGTHVLADVTPAALVEHRNLLAEDRSPATVNRYLAVLSHAFTIAVKEWQWLDENPLKRVSKAREPRGRVRFLSDDERARLLDACKPHRDLYLAVMLSLSTGGRQGEIMGLRWSDVDLKRGVITLHETKNGERRALPLAGRALELMRARVRRIDTDLVFPGSDPRKPISLRTAWLNALRKAEIEDFRWHDLRHSCASYLAMNGASLAEIAEVLGHKTLAMVKRYAHLSETHTAAVVASMNEKMFRGS